MKILIAEDDPLFRRMLSGLLVKWGHEPIVVHDGSEAWDRLQTPDCPRLALLDWVMPGLNGLDVCRAVRSRAGAGYTYLVLLTGNSRPEDAVTALEAGADDFVAKPFHPHELRARLNTAQRILNLEENLARQAFYDPLTGLPNRTRLAELFRTGRDIAFQNSQMLGVFYIDLDHFKLVNDSLGHAVGDAMLVGVANRLKHCVGADGIVSRIGGDEFVLLASVSAPPAAATLSRRLLDALTNAIDAAGHRFETSASIGISLYPRDGDDFDSLLTKADAAMYESKQSVRNSFQLFTNEIGERFHSRLTTESRLSGAVRRKEFALHYQPVYSLSDMAMTGSEALIRWNDPSRGMVYPADFIPIAEETGEITKIGKWVMEEALTQIKLWELGGDRPFRVAVNISANDFANRGLFKMVSDALARTGASPALVELEMTETVLVHDFENSALVMKELRKLGVTLAIDDFGTGYSSFAYLANLPIDAVKIDKSFLRGIHNNRRRILVLEGIVTLAHKLGLRVIAEGIEDKDQLRAVRDSGCDEAQGYLLCMPGLPGEIPRPNTLIVPPGTGFSGDLAALARSLDPARVSVL